MSKIAKEILMRDGVPPTITFLRKTKTLPELLNVQRNNAYKLKVMPHHWYRKGFSDCWYEIHKVKYRLFNGEPVHGKAWGIKYWNGEPMNKVPVEIRGPLKFSWVIYKNPNDNGIFYDPEKAREVVRKRILIAKEHKQKLEESKEE